MSVTHILRWSLGTWGRVIESMKNRGTCGTNLVPDRDGPYTDKDIPSSSVSDLNKSPPWRSMGDVKTAIREIVMDYGPAALVPCVCKTGYTPILLIKHNPYSL